MTLSFIKPMAGSYNLDACDLILLKDEMKNPFIVVKNNHDKCQGTSEMAV